jgi:hypothetical protein
MLKSMLEEESDSLGIEQNVYEVDVERQYRIAEAYGILAVPTLVAGAYKISGVPEPSDLRSFLFQAISGGFLRHGRRSVKSVLREVRRMKSTETTNDQMVRSIT